MSELQKGSECIIVKVVKLASPAELKEVSGRCLSRCNMDFVLALIIAQHSIDKLRCSSCITTIVPTHAGVPEIDESAVGPSNDGPFSPSLTKTTPWSPWYGGSNILTLTY